MTVLMCMELFIASFDQPVLTIITLILQSITCAILELKYSGQQSRIA